MGRDCFSVVSNLIYIDDASLDSIQVNEADDSLPSIAESPSRFADSLESQNQKEMTIADASEHATSGLRSTPIRQDVSPVREELSERQEPTLPLLVTRPPAPQVCRDRTAYLKTFTNDVTRPLLVDVIASYERGVIRVNIFFNLRHMDDATILEERHSLFTLDYNGATYENAFTGTITWNTYLMVRFNLPVESPPADNSLISFTLHDNKKNRVYENLQTCVVNVQDRALDLVICSYLSPYNSVIEVIMWLAYYRLQRVSKVIFYIGQPYPELVEVTRDLVNAGWVEFVDWSWPTTGILKRPQRENQQAQVMSCYYRYRQFSKYMLFIDVDEYVHMNVTNYGLDAEVASLFSRYPSYTVLTVRAEAFGDD